MAVSAFDIRRATLEDKYDELDELNYNFKAAKELGHLTTMLSLKRLNLSFNELSHVRGLQSLQQLQHINLSHNTLSSLEPVSSLRCLTSLIAGCNKISSTSALGALPTLKVLALHGNAIDKPSAVLLLSGLKSLQHLTLANNPICKQSDWQRATIGALSWLQVLDSLVITEAARIAARPHDSDWRRAVEAGDLSYSNSSSATSSRVCSATGQNTGGAASGHRAPSSKQLSERSKAGQPALQQGSEGGSSMSIKDVASLLPSVHKPQLKPSSLTIRPGSDQGQQQPSQYGYSRAKPVRVVHQQRYEGSKPAAVQVRSDGSAATQWPDGSMAAALDTEDSIATAAASTRGFTGGYRLLAMYRNVVGVAASFDSNGGFVQYPNGGLMLVWNRHDGVGTCYAPDGSITHSFNSRKKPLTLKKEVTAELDKHYSITFTKSCELQLFFSCEGCSIGLSLVHGAMLPDEPGAQQGAEAEVDAAGNIDTWAGQVSGTSGAASDIAAAAAAAAAASAGTPALLARARALMATERSDAAAADIEGGQEVAVAGTAKGSSSTVSTHAIHPAPAAQEDTQDLMARARALMAANHSDLI